MERSQLDHGFEVAVNIGQTMPRDPYATIYRHAVRKGTVTDLSVPDGVRISWEDGASSEIVQSRRIICRWDLWEERCAKRDNAADGQRSAIMHRLEQEADALTSVQRQFPTATCKDGFVVIPIADWLARAES